MLTLSRHRRTAVLACLTVLAACSRGASIDDELADMAKSDATHATQGEEMPRYGASAQPVRVGEAGDRFPACGSTGQVTKLDEGAALPVRDAPFESGKTVDQLANGDSLYVCTRSLDQKWLGVVYSEARALDPACGVSRVGVDRGNYAGPCRSGWVSSAFVRLVG